MGSEEKGEVRREVGEVLQYAYSDGDLSYHVNRYSSNRQDKVQTASILQGTESTITTTISSAQHPPTHHVLHAYGDLIVDAEATKEADNVRRVTLMQHFQLSHNLIAHSWLDVQHDHLRRRKGGREGGRKGGTEVCHHTSIPICNQV